MQLRYDPTYYWATLRLPRTVRPAVQALYGFVRGADELVDGANRAADPAARRRALDSWQGELERGLANGSSRHPVIAALVDAGRRHDLPLDELSVYMDSMRLDCGPVRVRTRAELDRYMRGSAGAVGLIMAALLDVPQELHAAMAQLGTAFQLTNFIRDVREDYELDRIYLPTDDLARCGTSVDDIAARRVTDGLRTLLAAEVGQARRLFAGTTGLYDDDAPIGAPRRGSRPLGVRADSGPSRGARVRRPRASRPCAAVAARPGSVCRARTPHDEHERQACRRGVAAAQVTCRIPI